MKKILFLLFCLFFFLDAKGAKWTDYPLRPWPNKTDTFLLGSTTNNYQLSASNLFYWISTNSINTNILYIDPVNGNDNSAERGNPNRPWLNASNAFKVLKSGDTVLFNPGIHLVETWRWRNKIESDPTNLIDIKATSPLEIRNKTNITIAGIGKSQLKLTSQGHLFILENATNINFSNLEIIGVKTNYPIEHSECLIVSDGNCKKIRFENMILRDNHSQGISCFATGNYHTNYTTYSTPHWGNEDWIIKGCSFYNIGHPLGMLSAPKDGTAVTFCGRNIILEGNYFYNCWRGFETYISPFYVKPGTNFVHENFVIVNNIFDNLFEYAIIALHTNQINWTIANNQFYAADLDDENLEMNQDFSEFLFNYWNPGDTNSTEYGFYNNWITNFNVWTSPQQVAIELRSGNKFNIEGNIFSKWEIAIQYPFDGSLGCQNIEIKDNIFNNIRGVGVYMINNNYAGVLNTISNINVVNNIFYDSGTSISLNANNSSIIGNKIFNTTNYAPGEGNIGVLSSFHLSAPQIMLPQTNTVIRENIIQMNESSHTSINIGTNSFNTYLLNNIILKGAVITNRGNNTITNFFQPLAN